MILEFCSNGSLLIYLRSKKDNNTLLINLLFSNLLIRNRVCTNQLSTLFHVTLCQIALGGELTSQAWSIHSPWSIYPQSDLAKVYLADRSDKDEDSKLYVKEVYRLVSVKKFTI